ncbi:MAG: hypothetical protein NXI21_07590 [Alphaproteobacteria bacterium]|nr:hypothetical protein [Alphaproteobacteria bacterium]
MRFLKFADDTVSWAVGDVYRAHPVVSRVAVGSVGVAVALGIAMILRAYL